MIILVVASCDSGPKGELSSGVHMAPVEPAAVVAPISHQPIVDLATGDAHSCALHADGLVSCWGANWAGQLGDGTTRDRVTPVRASVISDVVEIDAVGPQTCARKRDGTVWCWGSSPDRAPVVAPQQVEVDDAIQLAGSCALRKNGHVDCWREPAERKTIGGLDDAVHIASSWRFGFGREPDLSCAARKTGAVVCWTSDGEPRPIVGISDAVSVATGFDFACARHRDGRVTCWGDNTQAQLGRGTVADNTGEAHPPPLGPAPVAGITDAIDLVAGHMHACVRTKDQRVRCWGQALDNIPFSTLHKRPVDVGIAATLLASGGGHACALATTGKLMCWGGNESGQLGIGWAKSQLTPTRVPGIDDAVAVVAGHEHTCARRRSGHVACWGSGDSTVRDIVGLDAVDQLATSYDVCGRDPHGAVACRRNAIVKPVRLAEPAIDVATGLQYGCAVLASGKVSCWGNNFHGEFGNGSASGERDELPAQPAATGITDAVSIATGAFHACVIRKTGEVACWGDRPDDNVLGDPHGVPFAIAGIHDARQLALGVDASCALRATGQVSCWGVNKRGQLGNGTIATSMTPTSVFGLTDAVQISLGGETACARRATGEVVCWGRNAEGQLGDGGQRPPDEKASAGRSVPVLASVTDSIDVSTSGNHTCSVSRNGSVRCWGVAEHGEVGTMTSSMLKDPVPVSFD